MKDKDNKKEKRAEVGSFKAIIELTKELFKFRKDLPKRDEKRQITKIDVISVILTVVIVALIGVALWFIPFTNGFMRELMFWTK